MRIARCSMARVYAMIIKICFAFHTHANRWFVAHSLAAHTPNPFATTPNAKIDFVFTKIFLYDLHIFSIVSTEFSSLWYTKITWNFSIAQYSSWRNTHNFFFVFGVLNQRKRDVTQVTVNEIFCAFRLTFRLKRNRSDGRTDEAAWQHVAFTQQQLFCPCDRRWRWRCWIDDSKSDSFPRQSEYFFLGIKLKSIIIPG